MCKYAIIKKNYENRLPDQPLWLDDMMEIKLYINPRTRNMNIVLYWCIYYIIIIRNGTFFYKKKKGK